MVHTQAKIMTNQDVMYKYISKNMLFVATVSPKATGGIGSSGPDEASLVAYLIDTVTGRILHRVTHQGAQGPVHAVCVSSSCLSNMCWLFIEKKTHCKVWLQSVCARVCIVFLLFLHLFLFLFFFQSFTNWLVWSY